MDFCQLVTCDDLTLMEGFWCGLEDDIRSVMSKADPCWSLKGYINFALWIARSAFTADEAEPSPQSSHVAATPLSVPPSVHLLSSESPNRTRLSFHLLPYLNFQFAISFVHSTLLLLCCWSLCTLLFVYIKSILPFSCDSCILPSSTRHDKHQPIHFSIKACIHV